MSSEQKTPVELCDEQMLLVDGCALVVRMANDIARVYGMFGLMAAHDKDGNQLFLLDSVYESMQSLGDFINNHDGADAWTIGRQQAWCKIADKLLELLAAA